MFNKSLIFFRCIYVYIFLILTVGVTYGQEDSHLSPKQQMDEMTETAKIKWRYNPFAVSLAEKRMVGWQDPYANITRFWIGDNLSAEQLYPNPNFRIDDVGVFFTPTIATEIAPVAFEIDRLKFRLGVGVHIDFNMGMYGTSQRFGKNLVFYDYVQVETYLDFIIDDVWKLRWTPMKHTCIHLSGDILGDPSLYDPLESPFGDVGHEDMEFKLFYNYSWLNIYGGFLFNMTKSDIDLFLNTFTIHFGTDVRVPIWGEINFLAGFYVAAERTRFNTPYRDYDEDGNTTTEIYIDESETYYKWYPAISVGFGIEIERITYGFRYLRRRSNVIHSHTIIEETIGADITILY